MIAMLLSLVLLAHDPYSGWLIPGGGGALCCNNKDCRPVPHEYRAGALYLRIDDAWIPADPRLFLRSTPNPDGKAHACWTGRGAEAHIRCIMPPGGMV